MTFIETRLHPVQHEAATLVLDAVALAQLRTLASGNPAHPALGGPAGARAMNHLAAIGAIDDEGHLTPETWSLIRPITEPSKTLQIHACGNAARSRYIWVSDDRCTIAMPTGDHELTLSTMGRSQLGLDLTTWLGVRPLPEPEGRSTLRCSPNDLTNLVVALAAHDHSKASAITNNSSHPGMRRLYADLLRGEATAWVITSTAPQLDQPPRATVAVDYGRVGWWLGTASPSRTVDLAPVGVASIYIALGHLL